MAVPGAVPMLATGPDASSSPAKVLSPSKVCAPERPASSVETSGSAKLRVAPAAIAARSNTARRVGSASCASWKTASEKKAGSPAAFQALPSQARKLASSTTQACQPGRGTSRIQAPSTQ